MESTSHLVIRIYRNGSGQYRVFPSPALVERGQAVSFKNLVRGSTAVVELPFLSHEKITVLSGDESSPVKIPTTASSFEVYEVRVDDTYRAEGTSPPGFIVDP